MAAENMLNSYLCEQATLLLDAPLTIEKAEILKNAVLNQPIFAGQSLPPISPEMFAAIQDGSCPAVVRTYVKDNITAGTSTKEAYNETVESGAVTDEVLDMNEYCTTGKITKPLWETDGHFSTVYLVALQLGMSDTDARNLAIEAENPDTDIDFKNREYIVDNTWADGELQKIYHSLNGGFHGIEEFLTALGIISTDKTDLKTLGFLIHRFGDTYAHTRLRNINPEDLNKLDIKSVNVEDGISEDEAVALQTLMLSWQKISSGLIANKIPEWVQLINEMVIKYGNNNAFGLIYKEKVWITSNKERVHLSEFLKDVYKVYAQNPTKNGKLKLYGCSDCFMTMEHANLDGANSDYIFVRGNWYISYVKNLAALLKYKFNLKGDINISVFQKMVDYATKNKCSMRGIIDVEIALQNKKTNVDIYKFLTNWQAHMIAATAETLGKIDLESQYENDVKRAKNYLITERNQDILKEISANNYTRFVFHNKCK